MGRDGTAGAEEFNQFMDGQTGTLTQRRMQTGTPMLLQLSGGADSGGQEEMQICTLWISQDLQTLKWREQEGNGCEHELPLKAIADVLEDNTAVTAEEEGSYSFTIILRNGKGIDKKLPSTMNLICVSREDLTIWRDGLRLLCGVSSSVAPAGPSRATAGPAASSSGGRSAKGSASKVETEGSTDSLRRRLQKQEEANEKLQKENSLLKEAVRQKDASIAALLRDLQSRSRGNGMERCTKTGASSRESDEHLSYREAAILQHKNRKLQKTLRAKQQTIAELLRLVGKVTQQQGAESSAVEELHDDDSEPTAEEEKEEKKEREEDDGVQKRLATTGRATRFQAHSSLGRALRGRGGGRAAAAAASQDTAKDGSSGAAATHARPVADVTSSEEEKIAEEVAALAERLEHLERLEGDMSMEEMQFAPPPRGPSVATKMSAPARLQPAACNVAAAEPVSQARLGGPKEQLSSSAGVTAGSQRSTAALQALAREMELLEEKKRIVEQLARNLEPPSDGEEDDGFPLR